VNDQRRKARKHSGGEDLDYFRHLEELFIGLRGAPLLLSPADWEIARSWRAAGIPFDLVERVLREVFERAPDKRGRGGVRSLKYFDSAIVREWRVARELSLGEGSRAADPLDIAARLAALAAALPESLAGIERIRAQLDEVHGSAEAVETALAALDREMISLAEDSLEPPERQQIDEEVDAALTRMAGRVREQETAAIREQLEERQIRSLMRLPVLSLFSRSIAEADREE
jgi:hypothetical protein